MHGAMVSRHQPVCEIPGLGLGLLLFFDPNVFYNLENENELLVSMDIDHPVRNKVKKKKQYK